MEFKSLAGITNICRPVLVSRQNIVLFANGSCIQSICLRTGQLLGSYDEHKDLVTSILYDEDVALPLNEIPVAERHLAVVSASLDGAVHTWNLSTGHTYSRATLNDPVFKLKLVPRRELLADDNAHTETAMDLLITTAHSRGGADESKDDKPKIQFEVNSFDLQGVARNGDVSTVTTPHCLMEFLSFNVAANAKNATERTVTAIVYVKNKKLMMKLLVPDSENIKAAQVDVGQEILSLATHNATGSVALGLQHGEVLVLHNVTDYLRSFYHDRATVKDNFLTKTIMHWHAHGVLTVSFSEDGRFLYSGGEESVLVVWNLTKLTKNFLPRLGAPLCHLVTARDATKAAKVLTTTLDNCLRFVNTVNMEVEWFWQSAYIAHNKYVLSRSNAQFRSALLKTLLPFRLTDQPSEKNWACRAIADPLTGNVMVNGYPGQLQCVDVTHGVINKHVTVAPFTRVSHKDISQRLKHYVPTVTQYAADQSGMFLATVDVRRSEECERDIALKFWEFEASSGKYRLSAQMNAPHGELMITDIRPVVVFSHTSLSAHTQQAVLSQSDDLMVLVATASADGTVKVWRGHYEHVSEEHLSVSTQQMNGGDEAQKKNGSVQQKRMRWKCAYSFQYRNCPVTALAWSNDGSTLCVCHDTLLSFWDPLSVSVRHTLTVADATHKVLAVHVVEPRADSALGGGAGEVYLVVVTTHSLTVYSLLTLKTLWAFEVSEITACGVAQDERFVAVLDHTTASHISGEGWIAIAVSHNAPTQPAAPPATESEIPEKSKNSKKKSAKSSESLSAHTAASPTHEVLLFSPASAAPLTRVAVTSRVTSLDLLSHAPLLSSSSSTERESSVVCGVVGVTADAELFLLTTPSHNATSASRTGRERVASVKSVALPVVMHTNTHAQTLQIEKAHNDVAQSTAVQANATRGSNKHWMEQLLPERSEDLPRPSQVAREIFRHISSLSHNNGDAAARPLSVSHAAGQSLAVAAAPTAAVVEKKSARELPFEVASAIIKSRMLALFSRETAESEKEPVKDSVKETVKETVEETVKEESVSVAVAPVTPAKRRAVASAVDSSVAPSDDESVVSRTRSRRPSISVKPAEPVAPTTPVAPATPTRRSTRSSSRADLSESDNESVTSQCKTPNTRTRRASAVVSLSTVREDESERESEVDSSSVVMSVRKSARKRAAPLAAVAESDNEKEKEKETAPPSARKRRAFTAVAAADEDEDEAEPEGERRSTRRKSTK